MEILQTKLSIYSNLIKRLKYCPSAHIYITKLVLFFFFFFEELKSTKNYCLS